MTTPPLYLIVGTGSIGKRHMANLRRLFSEARIGCVAASGRAVEPGAIGADIVFDSLEKAAEAGPRFAIVASPAPLHARQAAYLVEQSIPVLIEKPLADSLARLAPFRATLEANTHRIGVGYNLRLLGSAICLKTQIDARRVGRIHSVSAEVGQYLPDWRPGADYRANVSAQGRLGGGALLELSHELDYVGWLFGTISRVYCLARNTGTLEIDVEDIAVALLTGPANLPIALHLDFLQRAPSRRCKVVGEHGTLIWDILANSVVLHTAEGQEVLYQDAAADRNRMYIDEISHFSQVVDGLAPPQVSLHEAIAVLGQIDALRRSAQTGASVDIRAKDQ